jgi:hypothetical protein
MCVICVCAKFHIPNSYSSTVIAIKLKDKYRFYVAAILVSYILKGGKPNITYVFAKIRYHLKVRDDGILIQYNYYVSGHYPSSCFHFKHSVSDTSVFAFRFNLLSRAQSIELVSISGQKSILRNFVFQIKTSSG